MPKEYRRKRDGAEMMTLSFSVEKSLVKSIDKFAARSGITRSGAMEHLLTKSLPKMGRPKKSGE